MARHGLRTRPPGGDWRAADGEDEEDADGDGRRIPSVPIPHHTHILLARVRAPYSPPRLRNGSFAHASRSGGQRNILELQALHPAQPPAPELAMARYGLRTQPPGGEPEAVDSDEAEAADGDGRRTPSGPIPHHTHILLARVLAPYSPRYHRNGNCTRARRSEGPRHRSDGFHILTKCVRVVECAPASLCAYSSPSHRFPDERTPIEAMPLTATSAELVSGLGCGFGIGLTRVGSGFGTGFTQSGMWVRDWAHAGWVWVWNRIHALLLHARPCTSNLLAHNLSLPRAAH